ncbi:hypothetical protein DPMN_103913 [Dreissena polymorpha]|uniref:Uncharacterized protein n=1 Tax=Dreissena polymorpha TaxID=45954 RepID=A0A9D4H9D6_DREPO|nr:hypothetical protein DPMN_103913 [Dreissena polymorpha]
MMLVLASSDDVIEPRIINLIQNVGLFNEVKHLHKQLSLVALTLDKVQSDTCSLADACEFWLDLRENEELQPYRTKIVARFNRQ